MYMYSLSKLNMNSKQNCKTKTKKPYSYPAPSILISLQQCYKNYETSMSTPSPIREVFLLTCHDIMQQENQVSLGESADSLNLEYLK